MAQESAPTCSDDTPPRYPSLIARCAKKPTGSAVVCAPVDLEAGGNSTDSDTDDEGAPMGIPVVVALPTRAAGRGRERDESHDDRGPIRDLFRGAVAATCMVLCLLMVLHPDARPVLRSELRLQPPPAYGAPAPPTSVHTHHTHSVHHSHSHNRHHGAGADLLWSGPPHTWYPRFSSSSFGNAGASASVSSTWSPSPHEAHKLIDSDDKRYVVTATYAKPNNGGGGASGDTDRAASGDRASGDRASDDRASDDGDSDKTKDQDGATTSVGVCLLKIDNVCVWSENDQIKQEDRGVEVPKAITLEQISPSPPPIKIKLPFPPDSEPDSDSDSDSDFDPDAPYPSDSEPAFAPVLSPAATASQYAEAMYHHQAEEAFKSSLKADSMHEKMYGRAYYDLGLPPLPSMASNGEEHAGRNGGAYEQEVMDFYM